MPENSHHCTSLALQVPGTKRRGSFQEIATAPLFEQYLVGGENQKLIELFSSESIRELDQRSPLILFGPSGVGKTILSLTLIARWLNDQSDRTFSAITALDFSRLFFRSIESDDMSRFRTIHRNCHCLLIDNLHDLADKEAVQGELIEVLNNAERSGQLVVFTSTAIPSFVPSWNDALVSRVLAGYSIEIVPPSPSTRLEILRRLVETEGLVAEADDLNRLNQQLSDGVTAVQLKGLVTRWRHQQKLNDTLDQKATSRSIERLAATQTRASPSAAEIAKFVAKEMHQTLESMRGPSRKAGVVRARGLAMLLIRQWTEASYQNIGELFGGRDHTTVMHACRKTEEELTLDPELSHCAERVRRKLL